MAADARLTIVLALRGRPLFTRRWLDYAQAAGLPFKVVVADGSDDKDAAFVHDLLADKDRFSNLDLEYTRYPFDRAFSDYYAKMAAVLSKVATPFAALIDNDDFPVSLGLDRATSFLEAHPGHAACSGRMAEVNIESDGRVYGGQVRISSGAFLTDLDQNTARGRVEALFARYQVSHYDVHRTPVLQEAYSSLNAGGPSDIFLAELWTAFLAAAAGPVKKLPDYFLVRQRNTPESVAAAELKKGDCHDRTLLPTWPKDFKNFVDAIACAIAARDGCSFDEAQSAVLQGYKNYAAPSFAAALAAKQPAPYKTLRSIYRRLKTLAQPQIPNPKAHGADDLADMESLRRFLAAGPPIDAPFP